MNNNLDFLVRELCSYGSEAAWIEFKHDNYDPQTIGKDISALANSALIEEKECAYFIWGDR